jgi:hypothetical protein
MNLLPMLNEVLNGIVAMRLALQSPTPEDVLRLIPALEQAVESMREAERQLKESPVSPDMPGQESPELAAMRLQAAEQAHVRAKLAELRMELGIVKRLVQQGEEFNHNWARLLSLTKGGYTPHGEPAQLSSSGTISMEG